MSKCEGCDWRITGPTGDTLLCFECGDVRGTEDVLAEQQAELNELRGKHGMCRKDTVQ